MIHYAVLAMLLAAAAPGNSPDTASALVAAASLSPCYALPESGALPVSYRNRGDTCAVVRVRADSGGAAWFELQCDTAAVWSPAKTWRYVTTGGEESTGQARQQQDADRKRRLTVLRKHRDWPRRIIRAVRDGTVCLDMTAGQLEAAWGEPMQKSSAFTVGLGSHETWFYTEKGGTILMVSLRDGRVIGWTLAGE